MKKINPRLLAGPLLIALAAALKEINVGKVRNTYALPDYPNYLLVVASDRLSIFDFVLNVLVKFKGAVLTAMTIDWLLHVFADVPHHLVAYGAGIDIYLPIELRNNPDLQSRAMVVRKLRMLPVEFVVRGNLMGSALKSYRVDGTVCGIKLPDGLKPGSELLEPLFSPTDKSETGHDQAITFDEMVELLTRWLVENGIVRDALELANEARDLALELYKRARERAKAKGIRVLDTKFEFGLDAKGRLTVADEILTPDSSRFTTEEEYQAAMLEGKEPKTSDKQYVRNIGATIETPFFDAEGKSIVGINKLKPEIEAHVDFVAELPWPEETMKRTTVIYLEICEKLTGVALTMFQHDVMDIAA